MALKSMGATASHKAAVDFVNTVNPSFQKKFSNIFDGKFGASRLPRRGPHLAFMDVDSTKLAKACVAVSGQYKPMVLLSGAKTKKLDSSNVQTDFVGYCYQTKGMKRVPKMPEPPLKTANEFAKKHLGADAGPEVVDGWVFVSKRVLPADKSCLRCHASSGMKDPLGVLVYAFKPNGKG